MEKLGLRQEKYDLQEPGRGAARGADPDHWAPHSGILFFHLLWASPCDLPRKADIFTSHLEMGPKNPLRAPHNQDPREKD